MKGHRVPIEYHLDTERGILYCTVKGAVLGSDVFAIDDRMRNDPEMRPEYHQVSDFRFATDVKITSDDLARLSYQKPYFRPDSRRAVVAKGPLAQAMTRMFAVQRGEEAGQIKVFDTIEEAEAWIGGAEAEEMGHGADDASFSGI